MKIRTNYSQNGAVISTVVERSVFILLPFIISFSLNNNQVLAQFTIPKLIPCVSLDATNIDDLQPNIDAFDCIEVADGESINFDPTEDVTLKAGKYIELTDKTTINPTSGSLTACIVPNPIDVVWYAPNATPGTVGKFEKLELGVRFNDVIEEKVSNYVNDEAGLKLNPFEPLEMDVWAEFWWYNETFGWIGPVKSNGFYFEDYQRGTTDWTKDTLNQYHFRIRSAPDQLGLWRCKVKAEIAGHPPTESPFFTFTCIGSDNPGYMRVGDNKKYFRRGEEPFFPVGHNLTWPRHGPGQTPVQWDTIAPPLYFEQYHGQLDTLKARGANYFRFISAPWATDIEFEKLGNYSDRMIHAWEMDTIIGTAKDLDLLIHYDMQIHYTFERPGVSVSRRWDWPRAGDPYNDTSSVCAETWDSVGYCYRNELDLVDPIDFLTDTTAKRFYKNRLRYHIARWGYSTNIGVLELVSEINNFGDKNQKDWLPTVDASGAITFSCISDPTCFDCGKPYQDEPIPTCDLVYEWQVEMCQFIKEELEHLMHPISLSYTGPPNIADGDYSYFSTYVDIINWNKYGKSIEKFESAFKDVKLYTDSTYSLKKPVMHSEYGHGDGTKDCDNGTGFRKTLLLTPFSGMAAAAMNWDFQNPVTESNWVQLKVIREFMEGIKLDEEDWAAGRPKVSPGKEVEMMYIRNFEADDYRAAGVVSNRSFNYHTQETGFPCNVQSDEILDNEIYQEPTDFISADLDDYFFIPDMGGTFTKYTIQWFNGITGDLIFSEIQTPNSDDELALKFPFLSGSEEQPIVFFQVFPEEDPSFKAPIDSAGEESVALSLEVKVDSIYGGLNPTNWDNVEISPNKDLFSNSSLYHTQVLVKPNPTSEKVRISIVDNELLESNWSLVSSDGTLILSGHLKYPNLNLDLSVYASGTYYFKINSINGVITKKIIKN